MNKAIVTGASKGLGRAIAIELAKRGYEVLLIARSESLLQQTAGYINQSFGSKARILAVDLSEEHAAEKIHTWCMEQNFHPMILVNNAGYACWGYFEQLTLEEQRAMLNVNVINLISLTHRLLPLLKQAPKAYILNVSSTTAFQPVSTLSLYGASKSFVRSFSRSLRYELRNSSVRVTCLTPGTIATEFMDRAGMDALKPTAKKFEMQAIDVARKGLNGMFKQKAEVIPGFTNYVSAKLTNLIPDSVLVKIAAGIYERFKK